jgi:hypothetical protein
VRLIRNAKLNQLSDPFWLESELLPRLGLNSELLHEFPSILYPYMGYGLLHWQYPNQFSQYLVQISKQKIETYLEIGVRHGGTFVITLEYLNRFHPIRKAIGVDIRPCPGLSKYKRMNPHVSFTAANSRSSDFRQLVEAEGPFDLVLIDGDHSVEGCRNDFEVVKDSAKIIVFHDIVSVPVPGVGSVWREVKSQYNNRFDFFEYTRQYEEVVARLGGPLLGIGVAVKKIA